ncbi:MAG TPA: hypothetical protein VK812_01235 [Candidatus Binatus sp.]|nr:hypothetical protein [Candidatus Binatus sp.]
MGHGPRPLAEMTGYNRILHWSFRGAMVFAKRLREGVVRGDITCSVRIWTSPHVAEGRRYRMGDGEIEIESVTPIGFPDITPELARESGFLGVLDLLKVAKHGKGNNIYLIRFHYIPPRRKRTGGSKTKPSKGKRSAS